MNDRPDAPLDDHPIDARVSCSYRLAVLAFLACLATAAIATFYPSGRPADETMELSFGATYAWIAGQSLFLVVPGFLLGTLIGRLLPRCGLWLGTFWILAVPLVMLCDVMTFSWIAERFLSSTMVRISTALLPGLLLHVSTSMFIQSALAIAIVGLTFYVVWRLSGVVARWWRRKEQSVSPVAAAGVFVLLAGLVSLPALTNQERTLSEMSKASTRHPFCAFRLVGFRGVGVSVSQGTTNTRSRLLGLQAATSVYQRERRQLDLHVPADKVVPPPTDKVVVIVIECLRPEIIAPDTMPNLYAFAQKSIFCRRNFSSGNATCYGMFGMSTGLEAIWFQRPIGEQPLLNRLLHEAGFEIGFYGGQTDWEHFGMSSFITPEHFEDFQIELPDLPDSDLRTVERSLKFLEGADRGNKESTAPRMSMAYMFATHRRFSEPEDRIFFPAEQESRTIRRSPEYKEHFYNAYKNSARTMDRMIEPLLRSDCTVIVMGDHGEPILDDGTACHGTRLSRFQNMTPAIVYSPGITPREIDLPTYHADLLPTLLSILQVPLSDKTILDGVDLTTAADETLANRSFLSRNYLDTTSLLIGPWTFDDSEPFGYRVVYDIDRWECSYLNGIDDLGYEWEGESTEVGKKRFVQWINERFGEQALDESKTNRQLFTQFAGAQESETRLATLEIAGDVDEPAPYLYELIKAATRDDDAAVRDFAKDLIIRINRYRDQTTTDP